MLGRMMAWIVLTILPMQGPATKEQKKRLSALDTMKIQSVGNPRISPDGKRIAYSVSETLMEKDKDKEWKTLTHIWVVPNVGTGDARQYTRGDKSETNPEWSPDGKHLAFLSNREEEAECQVYFMLPDGGEAWQVTTHKGGVSGFRFSPDGKKLALTAADQPTKEEEAKKKDKDDTILIDRDLKMTHLWLWGIEQKDEKRLTDGNFTCGDPNFSPDGTRLSFTTNPTPKADDGSLTDLWLLNLSTNEKKKLRENPGPDANARWSPDGQWIAFTGHGFADPGPHQTHLWLISANGGDGAYGNKPLIPSASASSGTAFTRRCRLYLRVPG